MFCCLFALVLLTVRTASAHAHLCYDGKEPPAAIHLADGGTHACETNRMSGHSGDKSVQIAVDVLLKKASQVDPWMPVLGLSTFQFAVPRWGEPVNSEAREQRVETVVYLRPPLRGPPG